MLELEKARFAGFFETPLLEHRWSDGPELNIVLRASILDHARRHPGTENTNVGGWHSDVGTLEFCGEAGRRLLKHMGEMTKEATQRLFTKYGQPIEPMNWSLTAWANVNNNGDFNNSHTHPGATWSGVYYVDSGESDAGAKGTALHIADPLPSRSSSFFPTLSNSTLLIRPELGLMLLFPSYVPHAVPPHRGDRPRISIAFNVRKDPFP